MKSWKERSLERREARQSKDEPDKSPPKINHRKKPKKQWQVIGASWGRKESVKYKGATKEQCEDYIAKIARSFISDYTQGWRVEQIP